MGSTEIPNKDAEPEPQESAEFIFELDRRLAEFENDPRIGIPVEQVKSEMRRRFGWE